MKNNKITFLALIMLNLYHQIALAQFIPGHFKGYDFLSEEISQKIFENKSSFQINYYLDNDLQIKILFGQIVGQGPTHKMEGAVPNNISFFMHYLVFKKLSQDISFICDGKEGINFWIKLPRRPPENKLVKFNTFITNLIQPLCQWPLPRNKFEEHLTNLWDYLVDYSPNQAAVKNIRLFFTNNYQQKSKNEFISDLFLTIFLHPEFILYQ